VNHGSDQNDLRLKKRKKRKMMMMMKQLHSNLKRMVYLRENVIINSLKLKNYMKKNLKLKNIVVVVVVAAAAAAVVVVVNKRYLARIHENELQNHLSIDIKELMIGCFGCFDCFAHLERYYMEFALRMQEQTESECLRWFQFQEQLKDETYLEEMKDLGFASDFSGGN